MLEEARGFRVRARAAIALGQTGDLAHVPVLERGLRDKHPLVRAACATALGHLNATHAIPALRVATSDRSARVAKQARIALSVIEGHRPGAPSRQDASESRKLRYAFVIGDMQNRSGVFGDEITQTLTTSLLRELSVLEGAAVLTSKAEIRRLRDERAVPIFRLDGVVTELVRAHSDRDVSLRCTVSFLVLDEGQRTLRGTLRGAATGTEGRNPTVASQDQRVARKALEGAVRSALRNASSMIEAAAANAGAVPAEQASVQLSR
jgi:hypothetical protein